MFKKVVYPNNLRSAKVGQRITHRPTGYVFEKSKNGRWAFVWEGETAQTILNAYSSGKCTVRSVANDLGLCHSSVQKFLDANNVLGAKRKLIKRGKKILATKADEIKRLYLDEHQNIAQISEHFEIAINIVANFIKKQPYRRTLAQSAAAAFKTKRRDATVFNKIAAERILNIDLRGMTLLQYREAVKKMTTNVMYNYGPLIDPEGKRSLHYHVDHIYSVSDGWSKLCKDKKMFVPREQPMPLHLICHPANLQMLTISQNVHKGRRSAYTVKELKHAIKKFEELHGEVFPCLSKKDQKLKNPQRTMNQA